MSYSIRKAIKNFLNFCFIKMKASCGIIKLSIAAVDGPKLDINFEF